MSIRYSMATALLLLWPLGQTELAAQSVATSTNVLRAAQGTGSSLPASTCELGWQSLFGPAPGLTHDFLQHARATQVVAFDDGNGPAMYVGGLFDFAGPTPAANLARWDGTAWQSVGGGLTLGPENQAVVSALEPFTDAAGSALYVGGTFSEAGGLPVISLARWNGQSWSSPLGGEMNGVVTALRAVQVAGDVEALYVGGSFTKTSNGTFANRVARFDGTSFWQPLGTGLNGTPDALAAYDAGQGVALIAAGNFPSAGGTPAANIARWDGASWSPLGAGANGRVRALTVHDDGNGAMLYAAGDFTFAGGMPAQGVARWNGQAWAALGSGIAGELRSLASFDDGAGQALFVGGAFTSAGGSSAQNLARWDGQSWGPAGGSASLGSVGGTVESLAVLDTGNGAKLHVGGAFQTVGGNQGTPVNSVATWDQDGWKAFGSGFDRRVRSVHTFDLGDGEALYVAGAFAGAGGTPMNRIGRFDGSTWSALGDGLAGGAPGLGNSEGEAIDMALFDDGSGPALYVGGAFAASTPSGIANRIARWDGQTWSPLGGGVLGPFGFGGSAERLEVFDDGSGPALYVGGTFSIAGGQLISNFARWDGQTWSAPLPGTTPTINRLRTFDDGGGAALYIAGGFQTGGPIPTAQIRRWDGQVLTEVAAPGGQSPGASFFTAMEAFDDGSGPALFVAGNFTGVDGVVMNGISRWQNQQWQTAGGLPGYEFTALNVVNELAGQALYGARINVDAPAATSELVRWNGQDWTPLGTGQGAPILDLASLDSGNGPELFVAGTFLDSIAGDSYLTRWACAPGLLPLPGCAGNPALLSATSGAPVIGGSLALHMSPAQISEGAARFYFGFDGTDGSGCGLVLAGLGELLLGVVPLPIEFGLAPVTGGGATVLLNIPNNPQLVGRSVAFQSAAIDFTGPPNLIEFSNGLLVTVQP